MNDQKKLATILMNLSEGDEITEGLQELTIDETGILVASWLAIHPMHRPRVYYKADGELLGAYIMPDYPEYATLVFQDYEVACSADSSWLDFEEEE